ncbi:MAG TPA: CocE/NonD family hydrolase [Pyrinomonadaceae bacterium]|jgi:putative CocE/NonD family hydrolase|nr:CocE/NonD family hydrolase [Pyrinomonadaceae bacterium]
MKCNICLRLLTLVLLSSLSLTATFGQPNQLTPQQRELADYIKKNYTKSEVMVPMRDGVKLFACIYEPKDKKQKYPIMFDRTPYSVGPYGPDNFRSSLGPDELFAREGYIFVYEDVRGRYRSEGVYEDVRPYIPNKQGNQIDETTDTYDTVDWLIKNVPNNNGRVGVYGISYPGFYTSMAGIDGHPAIKAISPQAPVSDWFHGDDNHHNGALFLSQNFSFFTGFGQPRPVPTSNNDYVKPFNYGTQDGYKFYYDVGGLKNFGDAYQKQFGFRIKFWDEMMQHPNYDQFWKERNIFPNLKNIHAAVMTVGGWYDDEDLFGALGTYQAIEKQDPGIYNVLVMGPWCHGCWARTDGDWLGTAYFGSKTGVFYREHFELPFFNYFLKDKGDISQIKEVNVFDTGANQWTDLPNWSPTTSTDTPLYIVSDGKLIVGDGKTGRRPPSGVQLYDEYASDPWNPVPYTEKRNQETIRYPRDFMTEDQRFAATRPDVLVYQTEPLTEDITVAGSIKPELFISSSGTDSDFIVKLIDVFPDDYKYPEGAKPPENSPANILSPGGFEMLLRGEPMPARFRNSFEKPEPLRPNVPTRLSYVMPGIVHTFKKGHRIMVQIQSTWFPLVARNPQKFMANYKMGTDADFQKATERVYHSVQYPSQIALPVLRRQQ